MDQGHWSTDFPLRSFYDHSPILRFFRFYDFPLRSFYDHSQYKIILRFYDFTAAGSSMQERFISLYTLKERGIHIVSFGSGLCDLSSLRQSVVLLPLLLFLRVNRTNNAFHRVILFESILNK